MRLTLYLIFIVTSDVNFTLAKSASRKKQDRCQFVTISSSARNLNQFATMTPSAQFSQLAVTMIHCLLHSTISRSEFCEINWHSIKSSASKQIARRATRVSEIKSSKCEVLLEKNHEATERIFVSWMKNLHRASSNQRNESSLEKNHEATERIFVNEATERIFTKRKSFLWERWVHLTFTMRIVSQREWPWICDKKKFSLWERWLNLTSTWRIVSLREWQLIVDLFVLKVSQLVSLLQRQSIVDLLL